MNRLAILALSLTSGCAQMQPASVNVPTVTPRVASVPVPAPTRQVIILNDPGPTRVIGEPAKPSQFDPASARLKLVLTPTPTPLPQPTATRARTPHSSNQIFGAVRRPSISQQNIRAMSNSQIASVIAGEIENTDDPGKLARMWLDLNSLDASTSDLDLKIRIEHLKNSIDAKQRAIDAPSSMHANLQQKSQNISTMLATQTPQQQRAMAANIQSSIQRHINEDSRLNGRGR